MKHILTTLILTLASLLLAACVMVEVAPSAEGPRIETLFVGPTLVDCVGVAPRQCLQVKRDPNSDWELFYDSIDGFTYEEGFEYELRVNILPVENPPADASSLQYELVELVSQTAVEGEGKMSVNLLDQVWYWQAYQDMAELNDLTIDDPARYTLTLSADGTFQAQADCNKLSGGYQLDDSLLTFAPGPMTAAECGPDSHYLEFVSRLGDVATYVFDGDQLVLNLKMDAGNMVFVAEVGTMTEVSPTLEGSAWVLNGLVEGNSVTATPIDPTITALFEDGQLTGSAGCNRYSSSYTVDGTALTLGPIASTRMLCEDAQNEREIAFLSALSEVTGFSLSNGVLDLLDAEGNSRLTFKAQGE
jgi:heat shock protein HslJ